MCKYILVLDVIFGEGGIVLCLTAKVTCFELAVIVHQCMSTVQDSVRDRYPYITLAMYHY